MYKISEFLFKRIKKIIEKNTFFKVLQFIVLQIDAAINVQMMIGCVKKFIVHWKKRNLCTIDCDERSINGQLLDLTVFGI